MIKFILFYILIGMLITTVLFIINGHSVEVALNKKEFDSDIFRTTVFLTACIFLSVCWPFVLLYLLRAIFVAIANWKRGE